MAYVSVPKDLTQIKTKFLFNLTKRQVVCFGIGILIGVPMFFLLKNVLPLSAAAMIMIVAMLPAFMFAMFERNGQPLEKILHSMIQSRFIRPKHRIYGAALLHAVQDQQPEQINLLSPLRIKHKGGQQNGLCISTQRSDSDQNQVPF